MPEKRGRFIVLEGIDGSGKSTQAELLAGRLFFHSKFNHVLLTREPYDSLEIRRRLKEENDPNSNADLMANLYIEDRRRHLSDLVAPNLEMGVHVVSDRYKHSTIAYQATQGLEMADLIDRHNGLLVPNMTIYVAVPVKVALLRSDGKEKKFENPEFQEKLAAKYDEAIERLRLIGEDIRIVDGQPSEEVVAEKVWENVKPILIG